MSSFPGLERRGPKTIKLIVGPPAAKTILFPGSDVIVRLPTGDSVWLEAYRDLNRVSAILSVRGFVRTQESGVAQFSIHTSGSELSGPNAKIEDIRQRLWHGALDPMGVGVDSHMFYRNEKAIRNALMALIELCTMVSRRATTFHPFRLKPRCFAHSFMSCT